MKIRERDIHDTRDQSIITLSVSGASLLVFSFLLLAKTLSGSPPWLHAASPFGGESGACGRSGTVNKQQSITMAVAGALHLSANRMSLPRREWWRRSATEFLRHDDDFPQCTTEQTVDVPMPQVVEDIVVETSCPHLRSRSRSRKWSQFAPRNELITFQCGLAGREWIFPSSDCDRGRGVGANLSSQRIQRRTVEQKLNFLLTQKRSQD